MARRSRKSKVTKQKVTYDSKETKTVLGLLSLLFSIVLYITVFIDPSEQNLFSFLMRVFGQTTIVAAFFFMNLGLYLFESNFPLASKSSIISQLLLLFLFPAFLTSLYGSKQAALAASGQGLGGGDLGYFLAYLLFSDSLVFAQFTPLILGFAILIFLPLAFSMSVARLFESLGRLFSWLFSSITTLFSNKRGREFISEEEETIPDQASRFSDFSRKSKSTFSEETESDRKGRLKDMERSSRVDDVPVTVKEKRIDESGLSSSELQYPNWELPPLSLLSPYRKTTHKDTDKERNSRIIEKTLSSFDIDAQVVDAFIGPSVIQYALDIPLGIKVGKITALSENLALALGVDSNAVRIESIPGTTSLGIEVPRFKRDIVRIKELMESKEMMENGKNLPVVIGKDIDGKTIVTDVQKMPHLLIAGATGSGKSILTNAFIVSLLTHKTPDELKLILVDPKKVELSDYNGIPHLLTPVITDMDKVVNALKWSVSEMDRRYNTLAENQVRNLEAFNEKMGFAAMPYIVIVIDEMADMMMTASRVEGENAIVRLAQKARAVGIHLILATQRPSVNVITGVIKANIPARIGMSVASSIDSRVILDSTGAESLMGQGDLLFKAPDKSKSDRLQSALVTQEEVVRVVQFIKSQVPEVEYATSILEEGGGSGKKGGKLGKMSDDDLFEEAVEIVVTHQRGSSSFLQRKLNIGFNRAARLLEEMEELGIVSMAEGSKSREVLISDVSSLFDSEEPREE